MPTRAPSGPDRSFGCSAHRSYAAIVTPAPDRFVGKRPKGRRSPIEDPIDAACRAAPVASDPDTRQFSPVECTARRSVKRHAARRLERRSHKRYWRVGMSGHNHVCGARARRCTKARVHDHSFPDLLRMAHGRAAERAAARLADAAPPLLLEEAVCARLTHAPASTRGCHALAQEVARRGGAAHLCPHGKRMCVFGRSRHTTHCCCSSSVGGRSVVVSQSPSSSSSRPCAPGLAHSARHASDGRSRSASPCAKLRGADGGEARRGEGGA